MNNVWVKNRILSLSLEYGTSIIAKNTEAANGLSKRQNPQGNKVQKMAEKLKILPGECQQDISSYN